MNLIEMMNTYWKNHEAKEYPGESGKWFEPYEDSEGKELMNILWKKLFIGSHFNLETKAKLAEAGYRCWVGDRDSFGILVACITKDGKSLSIG